MSAAGSPISINCKNWKNSITGGQVHYGGPYPFLHYPPYQRQGMSANSSPQIPDIPLLLGHLVVKGDNGAPIMKKTFSMSKDQVLICIFMTIQKSIILIFGIFWHKLPYLPPKNCISICQILIRPFTLGCWHNMWTVLEYNHKENVTSLWIGLRPPSLKWKKSKKLVVNHIRQKL